MTPEEYQRVRKHLEAALARSPEDRRVYLDEHCGTDSALRKEVESLLAQDQEDSFLEHGRAQALTSGMRLGDYEVVSALGVGGMGEVYRARDSKLGRDVAIKVLPREFSKDAERLARFQREARLLAKVNHPNIATLHGLEEHEGQLLLIMEVVEGETMAERIASRRLSIEEAVLLFGQIAEGLDAAHEKGIIHRDLKPANIKIGPNGKVKILDFGLARASAPKRERSVSESPPETKGTAVGVILGTAPYMSPEQARGQPLDSRTDIWSFGCVLYEALCGKAAFLGETDSDTISAILKNEPDWRSLPANTPAMIRTLLRRCFETDPGRRFRNASDVRIFLEEALADPSSSLRSDVEGPRRERKPNYLFTATVVSVLAVIVGALLGWRLWRSGEPSQISKRFAIVVPGLVADVPSTLLALSSEGRTLVYKGYGDGASQLYQRSMDQLHASPIRETTGGTNPFLSPDGDWVVFFAQGKLKKASLADGSSFTICDAPMWSTGTWGANDAIVFQNSNGGLSLVSADGGVPDELVTADSGSEILRSPHFLPGGRAVLFAVWSWTSARSIAVYSFETGNKHVLLKGNGRRDATGPRFASGHVVFGRGNSLWAQRFDAVRLETTGDPFPILEGVRVAWNMTPQFDVAIDGTLVYAASAADTATKLVWVDRQGREEPTALPSSAPWARVSGDGARVAMSTDGDVWIGDLASGSRTRVTTDPSLDLFPIWTPDGQRVVFDSHRDEPVLGLFWKAADGTGSVDRLMQTEHDAMPCCWSADGKTLVFEYWVRGQHLDIGVLATEGEREWEPLLHTDSNETAAALSPDGRWIAYASDETGQDEIYIQRFPEIGERHLISKGGGRQPLWSPGTEELFYRRFRDDAMMVVPIATKPTLSIGSPSVLFGGPYSHWAGFSHFRNYDVAADGQRFLMQKPDGASQQTFAPAQIVVVLNWNEELDRLSRAEN